MLKLDLNLLWTVINLLILFLILKKLLFGRVNKVLEARQKLIQDQIDNAKTNDLAAEEKLKSAEEILGNARKSAEEESKLIIENAGVKNERLLEDARKEANQIIESSRAKAEKERDKILQESKQEVAAIAIEAAKKVARTSVSETEEKNMFDELLMKVGEDGGR